MIFSEESSRAIYEVGNMELIELRQTSATTQCLSFLRHVPEGLHMCRCGVWLRPNQYDAALKTPYYRASVIISRGKKSGRNPGQQDHQKAMDAKRGVLKRGKYTSILDRWQNDEVFRESQLAHGWIDEWNLQDWNQLWCTLQPPKSLWKFAFHERSSFQ